MGLTNLSSKAIESESTDGLKHDEDRQSGQHQARRSQEDRRGPLLRPSYYLQEPEKHNIFSLITKSGWLLLVTKLLLSVVVNKVALESSTEGHVANLGLLLKDVNRNFFMNSSINLAIGIPLGMLADCLLGKKVIMVIVLCVSIYFYFYMVVVGLRPVWTDTVEYLPWKTQVFLQTTLHSIRGIETAAMLESLKSNDYKLLYVYTFLKIISENIGTTFYVVLYLLCISKSEDSDVIVNFVCLLLCIVVFFIWLLFVSSLKKSAVSIVSLNLMHRTITALIWNVRVSNRNESIGDTGNIGRLQPLFKNEQIKISKKILYLCLLIIPSITTGFLYLASENVLREPFSRLKSREYATLNLLDVSRRALILVTLPLVEFVIVPILRQILRRKITFIIRLVSSMVTAVVAYFYGVLVVRMLLARGSPLPDNWTSEVRFVNALNYSVIIRPVDKIFTSSAVAAKSEVLLTYVRADRSRFPSRRVFEVQMESSFKYVAAVSLEGEKCVTYFITDFMEIQRVPGNDPIFEGPPGTNYPSKARMYFANLDPEITVELVLTFQHSTFHDLKLEEPLTTEVEGGHKKTFQINAGTYILTIAHTDVAKSYTFGPGGVYGVIYSPEVKEGTLNYMISEILPPKSYSIHYGFLYECLAWISISFIVVIMEVFVFLKSPQIWRASAFSFYHFFNSGFFPLCHYLFDLAINESGLVGWWTIMIYTTIYAILCVVTGFIMIKFRRYFAL